MAGVAVHNRGDYWTLRATHPLPNIPRIRSRFLRRLGVRRYTAVNDPI